MNGRCKRGKYFNVGMVFIQTMLLNEIEQFSTDSALSGFCQLHVMLMTGFDYILRREFKFNGIFHFWAVSSTK